MTNCNFGNASNVAAENDAHDVDRGLDVPAPARGGEHIGHRRREAAITGLDHRPRRHRRVQIDRRVELFRAFEDRPEEFIVEAAAAIVAVDDGADEFVPLHHGLELGGRLVRRRGRQYRQSGEARSDAASPRRPENRWRRGRARPPRRRPIARRRARSATAPACRCRRHPSRRCGRRRRRRARRTPWRRRPPSLCAFSLRTRPGPWRNFGVVKCSSRVMVRMGCGVSF